MFAARADNRHHSLRPHIGETGMTNNVVPFPFCRRGAFIRRHAAIMAALSSTAAERHLANQLRIQTAALRRRGVECNLVEREQFALTAAIRAELCRMTPVRGGVA